MKKTGCAGYILLFVVIIGLILTLCLLSSCGGEGSDTTATPQPTAASVQTPSGETTTAEAGNITPEPTAEPKPGPTYSPLSAAEQGNAEEVEW